MTITHADDCAATEPGDDCSPTYPVVSWSQPLRMYVEDAEADFPDGAPWCLVHHRAWELADNDDR